MSVEALSPEAVQNALDKLEGWSFEDDKIHRNFQFKNFTEAFAFMTASALVAEKADHHPEWFNVYNRVNVSLTTHDAGNKVSHKDIALAEKMNEFAGKY